LSLGDEAIHLLVEVHLDAAGELGVSIESIQVG
jgi:hypothetical protein